MPTLATQALLFLSSYVPLLAILALRYYESPIWRYVFAGLAFLSTVALILYMRFAQGLSTHSVTPATAAAKDGDVMSYIVTYLVPFVGVPVTNARDAVAIALLLATLFVLYANSNMLFINPLLNFMGYRTFEIEDSEGCVRALLTKSESVSTKKPMKVILLGSYLMLEKRKK